MPKKTLFAVFLLFVAVSYASAFTQTITLLPPVDPVSKKYYEGNSCINFKLGLLKGEVLKRTKKNDWDLAYGFLSISEQDWFTLHCAARSVIQDLGERNWDNPGAVPVLEPLPPFDKGKPRNITIDSSADTHKQWAAATHNMAKIIEGHMYALHVENESEDFYVLLRVNALEQHTRCTISWEIVPTPQAAETQ